MTEHVPHKPPGIQVHFVFVQRDTELLYGWDPAAPPEELAAQLLDTLATTDPVRIEVEVTSEEDMPLCVASMRPEHLRAMTDQARGASSFAARLSVLAKRARDGQGAFLVARASHEDTTLRALRLAVDEEDLDCAIALAVPPGEHQVALPLVLPHAPQSVRSNWPLANRVLVFGEFGVPSFVFGPYTSDEAAAIAADAHAETVRVARAADGQENLGVSWRIARFENPLRQALGL